MLCIKFLNACIPLNRCLNVSEHEAFLKDIRAAQGDLQNLPLVLCYCLLGTMCCEMAAAEALTTIDPAGL